MLLVRWAPDVGQVKLFWILKGLAFILVSALPLLILLKLNARAQLAQQSTETRFRQFFDDAPFAAIVYAEGKEGGDGGDVVAVNRTWLQLTGYTREQIPTVAAWVQLAFENQSVRRAVLEEVTQLYAITQRRDRGELAITTASGEKRIWQFSSSPLGQDEAGRRMIMSMAVDVTARKQAELQAQQASQAADEASRAKDRFLAILSHELRTPLTPVLAALSDMEDDPRFGSSVREELAVMRQNVQTEARLIDDLLDLSRIVHGKLHVELQPVSLKVVLDRALKGCSLAITAKDLYLQTDIHDNVTVSGDAFRLQQVFSNVIGNAIKFTPHQGRIAVRCFTEGGSAVVEVSDTGVGIPPHMLPKMFVAFQQADEHVTRTMGGLGMGLAVCKMLIDLHGGQISIDSEGQGRGAMVRVSLPEHIPAAPVAVEPAAVPAPAAVRNKSAASILLVEDHPDTARLLTRILSARGHRVLHAATAADAVQKLSASRFDLLISDIGLPDGTGLDVMQAARARDPEMPGIAISGYGMDDDLKRSEAAGFSAHLIKPLNIKSLHAIMGNILGCSRVGQHAHTDRDLSHIAS